MTTLNSGWQEIGRYSVGVGNGAETAILYSYATEDISGNYSTVHTLFRINISGSGNYVSVSSWSLGLDGSAGTSGGSTTWREGNNDLLQGSWTVPHNADGTGGVTIHANFSSTFGISSWQPSISVGLQTIPRASQPSLNTSSIECDGTNSFTVYTNRASSSFTQKLSWVFGSLSGNIPSDGSNVDTSAVWTPSKNLLAQIPNASSGNGTIYCTTYQSGSQIGDTKSVAFTLTANSYVPLLSEQAVTEKNSLVGLTADYTVIGVSNKLITVKVQSQMYSTISSVKVSIAGTDYTMSLADGVYSYLLEKSQSGTYKITAVDSRGLSSSVTITQDEHKYFLPYATKSTFTRPTTTSNTGDLEIDGKWFNELSNVLSASVVVVNTEEGSTPVTVTKVLTTSDDTFKIVVDETAFTGVLDYRYAFKATATVTDTLGASVTIDVFLSSAQWVWMEADDSFWVQGTFVINNVPIRYNLPQKSISTSDIVANDGNYSSMFPYKFDYTISWMTADTDNVHVFPASETDFNNLDGCFNGSWSTYDGYLRLYFLKKPSATVNVIVGV